jgi:uncharacterized membrane protein YvbJ
MPDEGPSPEDIARFGGDDRTGYCPHCGSEVWDDAERCPKCGQWITGGARSRPPLEEYARRRMFIIVTVLTLMGFLALMGILRVF